MLRELSVQNLALIEDARVELQPGFCAWTGETGAGKSLLLGGLGLLLGERGSADLIRTGADEMRVTGLFDVARPQLRTAIEQIVGDMLTDQDLVLSRKLNRAGRSIAYVNDRPVAVATLRSLGELLVDIHGQRESHSLLQPAYQLQLLDSFGGLTDLRTRYVHDVEQVRVRRRRRAELADQRQQRQRELALLQFEREELDQADLKAGESAELTRERERLLHAQALQAFTSEGANRLYDDEGSVVEQLGKLGREAQRWAGLDPKLAELNQRLEQLAPEVRDLAETFRRLGEQFEADPNRQDEVERRLQLIHRLEKKYSRSVDELIAYHSTLGRQEAQLRREEDDLERIDVELAEAFTRLREIAADLSKQRSKVAKKLAAGAQAQLADLGMPEASLEAALEPIPLGDDPAISEIPGFGIDQLEFMLTANRGEPPRPLRKVASGGELSRTMLALKSVLAAHDPAGTLVFDEIDANVGGRLGDVLGEKLAALGKTHQVICVTHLPQVASYARHQWTIRKQTRGKRTTTTISLLSAEAERVEELASMLRGAARSDTTRQEAAAMLATAKRLW
ncbi:MAG TPA: DNA repair protein RecN [Gemmataceae bacterium]|nr:DNA repair protein RecN [Gemmataceae bacterium]